MELFKSSALADKSVLASQFGAPTLHHFSDFVKLNALQRALTGDSVNFLMLLH